jgi:hypothetical protein
MLLILIWFILTAVSHSATSSLRIDKGILKVIRAVETRGFQPIALEMFIAA